MSKVVAIMSMSLDGYVADLNDGVAKVWPSKRSGRPSYVLGAAGLAA